MSVFEVNCLVRFMKWNRTTCCTLFDHSQVIGILWLLTWMKWRYHQLGLQWTGKTSSVCQNPLRTEWHSMMWRKKEREESRLAYLTYPLETAASQKTNDNCSFRFSSNHCHSTCRRGSRERRNPFLHNVSMVWFVFCHRRQIRHAIVSIDLQSSQRESDHWQRIWWPPHYPVALAEMDTRCSIHCWRCFWHWLDPSPPVVCFSYLVDVNSKFSIVTPRPIP